MIPGCQAVANLRNSQRLKHDKWADPLFWEPDFVNMRTQLPNQLRNNYDFKTKVKLVEISKLFEEKGYTPHIFYDA